MHRETVVCLECGAHFRTLTRHIKAAHGLTPEEYKARWDLPKHTLMQAMDLELARRSAATRSRLSEKGKQAQRARKLQAEKTCRIIRNKRHDQKVSYDLLRQLVRQGISVARIASYYGISRMTVYNALRKTEE